MAPIPFSGKTPNALAQIEELLLSLPRCEIVSKDERYLHAEFTTRCMRWVDDVEFYVDDDEKLIHFRSASRVGYWDFGVNRRRMLMLTAALSESNGT